MALLVGFLLDPSGPVEAGTPGGKGSRLWKDPVRKIRRIIRRPRGPYMRGPFVIIVYEDEDSSGGYEGTVYEPSLPLKRYFILLGDVKDSDPRWPVLCLDMIEKVRTQAHQDEGKWELVYWAASDLELRISEKLKRMAKEENAGGMRQALESYGYTHLRATALRNEALIHRDRFVLSSSPPMSGKLRLTSCYGIRLHPIYRRFAFHHGVDLGFESGAKILSTGDGVVKLAGYSRGYGKLVEIQHANGLRTRYAHMSRIDVEPGQSVKAAQPLGLPGATGVATGPHLHWEVRYEEASALDPARILAFAGHLPTRGKTPARAATGVGD